MVNKNLLLNVVTAITLALLLPSAVHAGEKERINTLLNGFHKAAATGSYENYFDRYTKDAVFLGTDKSERWLVNEFKVYAKPAFEKGGWRYEMVERHVMFDESRTVAWFDEVLDNASFGKCRGTGVLIMSDGQWRVAHYSLTLLIPNNIAHAVGKQSILSDADTDAKIGK